MSREPSTSVPSSPAAGNLLSQHPPAAAQEHEKRLPVLPPDWQLDKQRQDLLLALYSEVSNGWRLKTDVRFKLLGFLPVVSVAVVITLLSTKDLTRLEKCGIAVFGLVTTLALWVYEIRNSQLYRALIGRGQEIEAELGVRGPFRTIPEPTPEYVNHTTAIYCVYVLSLLAWGLAALAPWLLG